MFKHKSLFFFLFLSLCLTSCNADDYITRVSEEPVEETVTSILDASKNNEFQKIYENQKYIYSFKEAIDVLQIEDKTTSKIYKTGIDMPNVDAETCSIMYPDDRVKRQECYKENSVIEASMVTSYIAMANSLVTAELYTESLTTATYAPVASSYNKVESNLYLVEDNVFRLDIDFSKEEIGKDIQIKAHLILTEKGFEVVIKNYNITGTEQKFLKSILIAPFFGSAGGLTATYDGKSYAEPVEKEFLNGYAVVPDGSGAIIPFVNNTISNYSSYRGVVYGTDIAHSISNEMTESSVVALKNPIMPVFGTVYSNLGQGFVSYATKGEEYMSINVSPDNSRNLQYIWTYPSFEYNFSYNQRYNSTSSAYAKLADRRNQLDIDIHYDLLANEEANYIGMAKAYQEFLNRDSITSTDSDIPLKVDFMMADVENSILGSQEVVVTTATQVEDILNDITNNLKYDKIISSLYGWQKGGVTLGSFDNAHFISSIGTKKEFANLFAYAKDKNIDISFVQDYVKFNSKQKAYSGNATKHLNGEYVMYYTGNPYIDEFAYLQPNKVLKAIESQQKKLADFDMKSMTVVGIGNILFSHEDKLTRSDSMDYFVKAFEYLKDQNIKINAETPNLYALDYVDRFFNMPVNDSQLLIERETIPFVQMILHNTLEMYAPYSNFSFYDQPSVLKMIDFNVYPSFVLSNDTAFDLISTNSSTYYSMKYDLYKDDITRIYGQVNDALKTVINSKWINRETTSDGLVINTYENGVKILINYNSNSLTYRGITVSSQGYEVIL